MNYLLVLASCFLIQLPNIGVMAQLHLYKASSPLKSLLSSGRLSRFCRSHHLRTFLIILLCAFVTVTHGQALPSLKEVLEKQFPNEPGDADRWVFIKDRGNIEKITEPLVKAVAKNYEFYKVTMTHHLGYHINHVTCVILFDSVESNVLLVPPLWYGGTDASLMKLFIRKRFDDHNSLLSFLMQLHDLMATGSIHKYVQTNSTDRLISYDLVAVKGSSITTGNGVSSSTIRYNANEIWRKIRVEVNNHTIVRYIEINPVTNEKIVVE